MSPDSGGVGRVRPVRWILPILLCVPVEALAADSVSRDLLLKFNARANRAERALEAQGAKAAIAIYEQALEDTERFGRVHLRLGQLYQQEGDGAKAAYHFRECDRDRRVDGMDRELICRRVYEEMTAPVTLEEVPRDGQVTVLAPAPFAGPLASGDRLPKGPIRLVVDAPGQMRRTADLTLDGPLTWNAQGGMERPTGPLIPGDFIVEADTGPKPEDPPPEIPSEGGLPTWPAYAGAGVGAALVGGGLYLGFTNSSELDDIRARQRNGGCGLKFCGGELADAENTAVLADALWMSGTAVLTGAVIWWLLADGGG